MARVKKGIFRSVEPRKVSVWLLFTAIPAIITSFPDTRQEILACISARTGLSTTQAEWVLVGGMFLIAIIIWLLVSLIWSYWQNGAIVIAVDDDARGTRISDYQNLREKAKKSILVMGIGLGQVSTDSSIEALLQKGINITFLIMDPDILKDPEENRKFSEFCCKDDYEFLIQQSIGNLKGLVARYDQWKDSHPDKQNLGTVEVWKYPYYAFMNVTISDPGEKNSKLVAEFCLPFTPQRIRTKLSHGRVKELIESQTQMLLCQSRRGNPSNLICKS